MILNTKEFKNQCQTILFAVDNQEQTLTTEALELSSNGTTLNLNVTNQEYYSRVKFTIPQEEALSVAVNAKTFLSLISKITTNTIELKRQNNALVVKGNGEYKLPIIFNNNEMIKLPEIKLGTVTNEMEISSTALNSILNNNSKVLVRGTITKPAHNYYYIDEAGAITATSSDACVNSFTLPKPIKLMLSDKVVKLFKLFKGDTIVKFSMGHSQIADDLIQTTVKFKTDLVEITAKLTDSSLITSVAVSAIRGMADKTYQHNLVLNRNDMISLLNRIMIFSDKKKTYGKIKVTGGRMDIKDYESAGFETIFSTNEETNQTSYDMILDLKSLKLILDGNEDEYVTMCFGDTRAVVIKKNGVCDIIPELKVS